jgi:peptidoglycan hydrolase CwlO-like protein
MIDSMTIALFVLALISFIFAISAIFWLSIVSKHLSALKAGKLTEAADKTASLESRITGCQNKADENRNQLAELQSRLNQVTAKLEIAEQTIDNCTAYIAKVSEKMASFELRIDEF